MELFLSSNLKYLRKRHGLSQVQLAESLKITRNKVVSYESSSIEPKLGLLIEMSKFFQIRVSSLLSTKLTDDNYERQRAYYHFNVDKVNSLEHTSVKVDTETISSNVQKLHRLALVYKGLKTLYSYKEERGMLDQSTKELAVLLDEILSTNKDLLEELYAGTDNDKKLQELLDDFA